MKMWMGYIRETKQVKFTDDLDTLSPDATKVLQIDVEPEAVKRSIPVWKSLGMDIIVEVGDYGQVPSVRS